MPTSLRPRPGPFFRPAPRPPGAVGYSLSVFSMRVVPGSGARVQRQSSLPPAVEGCGGSGAGSKKAAPYVPTAPRLSNRPGAKPRGGREDRGATGRCRRRVAVPCGNTRGVLPLFFCHAPSPAFGLGTAAPWRRPTPIAKPSLADCGRRLSPPASKPPCKGVMFASPATPRGSARAPAFGHAKQRHEAPCQSNLAIKARHRPSRKPAAPPRSGADQPALPIIGRVSPGRTRPGRLPGPRPRPQPYM